MGKSLNDLDLKNETLPEQTLDDLPEFGSFGPPPQPGPYRFQLPGDLSSIWEPFDVDGKGQRIRAIFDRSNPLTIVQSPGNRYQNEAFETRLSNAERKRGKDGPEASDLDYLLRAFGEKTRPKNNKAYAEAVMKHAGKSFGADISFSFSCRDNKPIRAYVDDGNGGQKVEQIEGQMGCGKKLYQKDIQRQPDGDYPHEILCPGCNAVLRAFANLENFRA